MSDKKLPAGSWYHWYPEQYIADEKTQAISWEARAIWRELLDVLWGAPGCKFPLNLKRISNVVRIPLDIVKESWPEIMDEEHPLFESNGKFFWSRRLCEQNQKARDAYDKMRAGGKKGAAKRYGKGEVIGNPKGKAIAALELDNNNINSSSRSYSAKGHPMGHPKKTPIALIKELHTEANQEADNLINQSGSIGMYGTPEGRNEITLQVMKKSYFSWSTICNLQQGATPKWKAAFVDEYKRQSQKKGRTP